ncbi:hypothetical protein [Pseudofrankia asymbiotica]|nr:hypothetical protein [Pseudofrankia asymbiotica]
MTSTSPVTFPYGDVTAVPAAGRAASASQDTAATIVATATAEESGRQHFQALTRRNAHTGTPAGY